MVAIHTGLAKTIDEVITSPWPRDLGGAGNLEYKIVGYSKPHIN